MCNQVFSPFAGYKEEKRLWTCFSASNQAMDRLSIHKYSRLQPKHLSIFHFVCLWIWKIWTNNLKIVNWNHHATSLQYSPHLWCHKDICDGLNSSPNTNSQCAVTREYMAPFISALDWLWSRNGNVFTCWPGMEIKWRNPCMCSNPLCTTVIPFWHTSFHRWGRAKIQAKAPYSQRSPIYLQGLPKFNPKMPHYMVNSKFRHSHDYPFYISYTSIEVKQVLNSFWLKSVRLQGQS